MAIDDDDFDDDFDDDLQTDEERTVDRLTEQALEELEARDTAAALVTLGRLANELEGIRDWSQTSKQQRAEFRVRGDLVHEAYSLTRAGLVDEAIARLKLWEQPKWGGFRDSESTQAWTKYREHMREQREAEIAKRDG
jgi:hypothetical protein